MRNSIGFQDFKFNICRLLSIEFCKLKNVSYYCAYFEGTLSKNEKNNRSGQSRYLQQNLVGHEKSNCILLLQKQEIYSHCSV